MSVQNVPGVLIGLDRFFLTLITNTNWFSGYKSIKYMCCEYFFVCGLPFSFFFYIYACVGCTYTMYVYGGSWKHPATRDSMWSGGLGLRAGLTEP